MYDGLFTVIYIHHFELFTILPEKEQNKSSLMAFKVQVAIREVGFISRNDIRFFKDFLFQNGAINIAKNLTIFNR